ncbi:MAG: PPOX class F420-dependent oxidoreductase [Thermoleophilaceae bacterium]
MAEAIEGRARELLEAPNFCHVGSLRKDGTPAVSPVWVDVQGDRVVLNSAEGRAWPANVRRDPRVNLTVQNMENPYEFVSIKAHLVEDTQEGADEHIDAMAMKYLGEEKYPFRSEGEVRVMFKFEADDVSHFGQ